MNEEAPLSPDSTLRELFKVIEVEEGVNVVPVSLNKSEDNIARLMIAIVGSPSEANVIMANLMSFVDDMHDMAAQHEADEGVNVVGMDGNPIDDTPRIIS